MDANDVKFDDFTRGWWGMHPCALPPKCTHAIVVTSDMARPNTLVAYK